MRFRTCFLFSWTLIGPFYAFLTRRNFENALKPFSKALKTRLQTHSGRGLPIRVNFYGVLPISTSFIEKAPILKYIQ